MADSESIGRGSKRSFGKRRAGSTASSKHSQPQPQTSEKTNKLPPVPATENREGSTRSKTKKSGGLLSCLPCFAPKESRSAGDEDVTENAKQAAKPKPTRTTQATPPKKQENHPAESSTADSKELLDEKSGESYGKDHEKRAIHGDAAMDPTVDTTPRITRTSSKRQPDDPLPPLPQQTIHLDTNTIPQIGVQGPTPGTTPIQPRPSAEQERIIQDQTAHQQEIDHDLEMRDVPISSKDVQTDEGSSSSVDQAQKEAPKIPDLPPPPPLEQRQIAIQEQLPREVEAQASKNNALLPPIRPEFVGKKCLVLDLDETLVHSSFKVCNPYSFHHSHNIADAHRSSTKLISRYQWKSKDSITMYTSSNALASMHL